MSNMKHIKLFQEMQSDAWMANVKIPKHKIWWMNLEDDEKTRLLKKYYPSKVENDAHYEPSDIEKLSLMRRYEVENKL